MQTGEVRGPVRSDFGYHVIRLDELRAGTTQPFEAVRDELASELRTRRARAAVLRSRESARRQGVRRLQRARDRSVRACSCRSRRSPAFPRTGDTAAFTNSAAVVQAAFDEQMLESGKNSALVELADDHVRRAARHRASRADGEAARRRPRSDQGRAHARSRRGARGRPRPTRSSRASSSRAPTRPRSRRHRTEPGSRRRGSSAPTRRCRPKFSRRHSRCRSPRRAPLRASRSLSRTAVTPCSCCRTCRPGSPDTRGAGGARSAATPARRSVGLRGAHELRRDAARAGHGADPRRHPQSAVLIARATCARTPARRVQRRRRSAGAACRRRRGSAIPTMLKPEST